MDFLGGWFGCEECQVFQGRGRRRGWFVLSRESCLVSDLGRGMVGPSGDGAGQITIKNRILQIRPCAACLMLSPLVCAQQDALLSQMPKSVLKVQGQTRKLEAERRGFLRHRELVMGCGMDGKSTLVQPFIDQQSGSGTGGGRKRAQKKRRRRKK